MPKEKNKTIKTAKKNCLLRSFDNLKNSLMKACIRQKPAATYFPAMGSIIGAGELGFRVRDGNGHVLPAMAAGV